LLPEYLDDFIAEDNTVRIVDVFINELDLVGLSFDGAKPAATGKPSHHPSVLLKLHLTDTSTVCHDGAKSTVEHVFSTFKHWTGWTHFLTRDIQNVATEMSLNVLAYNFKRVLSILGFEGTRNAMRLMGA
jgi:hypothetical protein